MELLIVIVVTMMLTSLLLPAMNRLRENVHRVICSSNQRQMGVAMGIYSRSRPGDPLPRSSVLALDNWQPNELMASWQGSTVGWDGLGLLYEREYCGSHECFYCPSHTGEHPVHRYAELWSSPGSGQIFTNYHYAGDRDWSTKERRFFRNPENLVLLTDGLRTASDVNHDSGMNVLYGDMSVRWRADLSTISSLLPEANEPSGAAQRYSTIWGQLQLMISPD